MYADFEDVYCAVSYFNPGEKYTAKYVDNSCYLEFYAV